ncbi:Adrenodoxin, mitochondrial [Lonchura striata]|uniref:Adrenal ferredoxin n=1 Tax=Lonchura striata TaxID=40157 RepID=A0A218UUI4_9PASE|nr:adrenodoxin, mitochondrial [Lonchura striata domestica]OWK57090.1 Adrenodoxin, mitochondrial [Lonchura striata domestica]
MAAPGPARLFRAAAASSRRWLFSATSPAAGPRPGCSSAAAAGRAARPFSLSAQAVLSSEDKITVHFINRDGDKLTAKGKPGDSLLDVVIDNNLDIDGFGACEGTLACSTCHLIFEDHIFEKLDAITDEEMDMLDLAYGLTETSRLGCQICLKKSMNDMTVRVPEAVADARQSVDMSKNS